jgi:hypothetical protein
MSQVNEAKTALRAQLRFIKEMGGDQSERDAAIARNVLHEDLGYYDKRQFIYDLDEATRDRLITHARQDAAHAVISVSSIQKQLRKTKRLLATFALTNMALTIWVIVSMR